MNKGRDYYRALQAKCRYLSKRKIYPQPLDADGVAYGLSDRAYKRTNVKNKQFKFTDATGKPQAIPYQTCTYVRLTPTTERLDAQGMGNE